MADTTFPSASLLSPRGQGFVKLPDKPHASFTEDTLDKNPPINLSVIPNSEKKLKTRSPRGLQGINNFQSNQIYEAVSFLERTVGKERFSLATITTPNLTGLQLRRLWSHHAGITSEIKRAIVRRLKKCPYVLSEVLIVTELQTKRFKRTGLPYLHLHVLFQGRGAGKQWVISHSDIQAIADRAFKRHLKGQLSNPRAFKAGVDIESVQIGVAGYLSKKETKDKQTADNLIAAGFKDCIPSHWVCMTHGFRNISNLRTRLSGKASDFIYNLIEIGYQDAFEWLQPVHRERGAPSKGIWGYSYRLTSEWQERILWALNR